MARPRIEINWEEFDKLCGMLCTQEEIAAWFQCSVDTIDKALHREKDMGFTEYFKMKSAMGKMSLRRTQFELAVKDKHPTMLIWLGKQHLGQTDKQEVDSKSSDGTMSPKAGLTGEALRRELDKRGLVVGFDESDG